MKIARDLLILAATAQRAGNDQQASKLLGLCVNHPDFNALSSYIMACDASAVTSPFAPMGADSFYSKRPDQQNQDSTTFTVKLAGQLGEVNLHLS
jgi:hypothetical protein